MRNSRRRGLVRTPPRRLDRLSEEEEGLGIITERPLKKRKGFAFKGDTSESFYPVAVWEWIIWISPLIMVSH